MGMFLFSALSIYVIFGKEIDTRKGNGNGPKRPMYTDQEIIASIKDELNQRLSRHKRRDHKQPKQQQHQPSIVRPTTDSPLDDLFSSTEMESFNFNDFTSTEMDESSEIEKGARKQFADDFPAISRTVNHLNEALSSLDYLYDMDIDFNMIDAIKDTIHTLLDEYALVKSKTNSFIAFIRQVWGEGDNRRKLLLRSVTPQGPKAKRERKGYNDDEQEDEDMDEDMEISEVLLEQFGDDIDAIQGVMGRLVDALDELHEYSDTEDEEKSQMEDMIEELLDEYILIISDTNGLINLFQQFYRAYGHRIGGN